MGLQRCSAEDIERAKTMRSLILQKKQKSAISGSERSLHKGSLEVIRGACVFVLRSEFLFCHLRYLYILSLSSLSPTSYSSTNEMAKI